MARVKYLILLVLGALALATVAAGAASETGVTSTQVTIGGTTPLSGAGARYPSGAHGAGRRPHTSRLRRARRRTSATSTQRAASTSGRSTTSTRTTPTTRPRRSTP